LINEAAGVISAPGQSKGIMKIDTGSHTIMNAGVIQTSRGAGLIIDSPVDNTGKINAMDGTMTFNGAVTGSGQVGIASSYNEIARLDFNASFNEDVTFQQTNCEMGLAQSQGFTASVTGFSRNGGGDLFDLGDISFVDAGEATFSGTSSGGVLTVTDGTHTANINLKGNYLGSTFVASSDGHGGVDVVATSAQTPSAAHFVNAMAAISGHGVAAGLIDARAVNYGRQMSLAAPRLALA